MRKIKMVRRVRREKHLYRDGAEASQLKNFEAQYGKQNGQHIYYATVGKVKEEREAKGGDMMARTIRKRHEHVTEHDKEVDRKNLKKARKDKDEK